MAMYYPLALGVGYEGTSLALNENLPLALLGGLLLAKVLGGAVALGSGTPGGVFSPALFIGAMLGGVYWYVAGALIPVELIDYDLVIAVMLAAAMASTFMQLMPHSSFFRWQLAERGINLNTGRDHGLLRTKTIDEFVTQNFIRVESEATLRAVESSMYAHRRYIAIVVNEDEEFIGSLSTDELVAGGVNDRDATCESAMNTIEHAIPHSTSLLAAQQFLNELETNYAPVTKTGDDAEEVVGVIYRSDVLKALYEMMRAARSEEYGIN